MKFEQAYLLVHFRVQEKELSKLLHYYEEESWTSNWRRLVNIKTNEIL